jgi:hypothetical protein
MTDKEITDAVKAVHKALKAERDDPPPELFALIANFLVNQQRCAAALEAIVQKL